MRSTGHWRPGLATALSLRAAGSECTIYEGSSSVRIDLLPHAVNPATRRSALNEAFLSLMPIGYTLFRSREAWQARWSLEVLGQDGTEFAKSGTAYLPLIANAPVAGACG